MIYLHFCDTDIMQQAWLPGLLSVLIINEITNKHYSQTNDDGKKV